MKKFLTFISALLLSFTLVVSANDATLLAAETSNEDEIEEVEVEVEKLPLEDIRRELLGNIINIRKNDLLEIGLDSYSEEGFAVITDALVAADKAYITKGIVDSQFKTKVDELNYHIGLLSGEDALANLALEAAKEALETAIQNAREYIGTWVEAVEENEEGIEVKDAHFSEFSTNMEKYVNGSLEQEYIPTSEETTSQPIIQVAIKLIETAEETAGDEKALRKAIATITDEKLKEALDEKLYEKAKELKVPDVTDDKFAVPEDIKNEENKTKFINTANKYFVIKEGEASLKESEKLIIKEDFTYNNLLEDKIILDQVEDLAFLKQEIIDEIKKLEVKYGEGIINERIADIQEEGTVTITLEGEIEKLDEALNEHIKEELSELIKDARDFLVNNEYPTLDKVFTKESIDKIYGERNKKSLNIGTLAEAQNFVKEGAAAVEKFEEIEEIKQSIAFSNLELLANGYILRLYEEIGRKEVDEVITYSNKYTKKSIEELEKKIETLREKIEGLSYETKLNEVVGDSGDSIIDITKELAKELDPKIEQEDKILKLALDMSDVKELFEEYKEYLDGTLDFEEIINNTNITEEEKAQLITDLENAIVDALVKKVRDANEIAKTYYIEEILPSAKYNMNSVIEVRTFLLNVDLLVAKENGLNNLHTIEILREALDKLSIDNIDKHAMGNDTLTLVVLKEEVIRLHDEKLKERLIELFTEEKEAEEKVAKVLEQLTEEVRAKLSEEELLEYDKQVELFKTVDNTWKAMSKWLEDINAAIDKLARRKELNKEDLNNAIKEAEEYLQKDVLTDAGVVELNNAIAAAKDALNSESLEANEIKEHINKLDNAKKKTKAIEKANNVLQNEKDQAEKLLTDSQENKELIDWEDIINKDHKEDYKTAKEEAEAILERAKNGDIELTLEEVENAIEKLKDIRLELNLKTEAVKQELEETLEAAKQFVVKNVTGLNVENVDIYLNIYNNKVAEARALLEDSTTTEAQLQDYIELLSIKSLIDNIFKELNLKERILKDKLVTESKQHTELVDTEVTFEDGVTNVTFDLKKDELNQYEEDIATVLTALYNSGIRKITVSGKTLELKDKDNEVALDGEFIKAVITAINDEDKDSFEVIADYEFDIEINDTLNYEAKGKAKFNITVNFPEKEAETGTETETESNKQ